MDAMEALLSSDALKEFSEAIRPILPASAEPKKPPCSDCNGTGRDNVPYGERCDSCDGDGSAKAPATLTAEQAWEKMEQGWQVNDAGRASSTSLQYMAGDGLVYDTHYECDPFTKNEWLEHCSTPQTLHGIHPDAHAHAMQRLIAAGLKVGSDVEVMREAKDCEGGWGDVWVDSMHARGTHVVAGIDPVFGVALKTSDPDGPYHYPAHVLRLVEADPATEPKLHRAIQRVAVIVGVDYDKLVADIAAVKAVQEAAV